MLDEGRMKYVLWTNWAEQTYQHLQKVDELEWRKFKSFVEGNVYVTFMDGCPVAYFPCEEDDNETPVAPEDLVLADLMRALRDRDNQMKELSDEERSRWVHPIKGYTTWAEFDTDECGCAEDQECPGCIGR